MAWKLTAEKDTFSDELNKRICDLQDAEAANVEAINDIGEERRQTIANAAATSATTLVATREDLTAKRHNRFLERLELATVRHNLTVDCLAYTRERLEQCREQATTERDKARKRFKNLGIELETMPAFGLDNRAAEIQFHHKLLEVASVKAAENEIERCEQLARDLAHESIYTENAIKVAEESLADFAAAVLR